MVECVKHASVPPMGREATVVFIDGGYLNKVAEHELCCRVDMGHLVPAILGWMEARGATPFLLRAYYYNCLPWMPEEPTGADEERFRRMQAYLDFVRSLGRFMVRVGVLRHRGFGADGQPVLVQKRVDLMLGLDLAMHVARRDVLHVVLLTGDGDMVPAAQLAREHGMLVWLVHGANVSADLLRSVDEKITMTTDWVPMRKDAAAR